ncbi:MAG: hypothetical protein L0H03_03150 [Rhodococcus sp. (in: high G+C Gram-positive bacteria)]|uniref:hypothetical protein n=1 Tax=Rhodococcus qingshengii TaxID=334542 RepID=UPI000E4F8E89|nr:hypothetical protein [Rhodococcus qingshengii]MDN5544252.1 hypothetical protein [Rhodococcus sp. (in: high G+C Gram-positive bacteria)]RGP45335.1 hypothetical protein AWH04_28400 [Rhodococcus erythropolis]
MSSNDFDPELAAVYVDAFIGAIDESLHADDPSHPDHVPVLSEFELRQRGRRSFDRAMARMRELEDIENEDIGNSDLPASKGDGWSVRRVEFALAASSQDTDTTARIDEDPETGRKLIRTALEDGENILVAVELAGNTDPERSLMSLSAVIDDDNRLDLALTVREHNGNRVAEVTMPSRYAYSDLAFSGPYEMRDVPSHIVGYIADSVRLGSAAEVNRWRAVARELPQDHPVRTAVLDGLR